MEAIRAKFRAVSVMRTEDAEQPKLAAVYGKQGSINEQWSKATPTAAVEMWITNADAWGFFKPGRQYIATFVEAGDDE